MILPDNAGTVLPATGIITLSEEFKKMEKSGFNTGLLHGKTSSGYSQREILPPVSQVTAFEYESMEELEKVFAHKSMSCTSKK